MIFDGWPALARTLVVGMLAYASIIVLLRVTGKRSLSKWNAFDFVVTVALGSTLATAMLSQTTTWAQAAFAFGLLVVMQYMITWLAVRFRGVRHWIKATPSLLLYQGNFVRDTLRRERVTEGEVRAAVRAHGFAGLEDVQAVILETDGGFSVIADKQRGTSALEDVSGYPVTNANSGRHRERSG